jgi:hypothetical protein
MPTEWRSRRQSLSGARKRRRNPPARIRRNDRKRSARSRPATPARDRRNAPIPPQIAPIVRQRRFDRARITRPARMRTDPQANAPPAHRERTGRVATGLSAHRKPIGLPAIARSGRPPDPHRQDRIHLPLPSAIVIARREAPVQWNPARPVREPIVRSGRRDPMTASPARGRWVQARPLRDPARAHRPAS